MNEKRRKDMMSWEEIEDQATENGFIPNDIYLKNASGFRVCPPIEEKISRQEAAIWDVYLNASRKKGEGTNLYSEMFRYEWYEGRKRTGFWGNIEHAVRDISCGESPRLCIFSAGSGRDLLKVGLAAGIWTSTAPDKIKGTYKEINMDYFRLAKPDARIIVTEYGEGNFRAMERTVANLLDWKLLTPGMVFLSRWNFREKAPVVSGSQDIVVFSLTGNYAGIDEQPLILREIARCVKKDGYMIASTLSSAFDFLKARGLFYRLKFFLKTPLGWPVALEFMKWQMNWAKLAGDMNKNGFWATVSARIWAEFLEPAGMEKIRIYDAPCDLVPVEVLVTKKTGPDRFN
jgi:hypothetical protein